MPSPPAPLPSDGRGWRRALPDRGGEGASRTGDYGAQRTARPIKFKPYKSWCYQLAAYRQGLGVQARCLNLIVNSVVPERPIEHVWGESEMDAGLRAFMAARELWVIEKGYDPSEKLKAETLTTEMEKAA